MSLGPLTPRLCNQRPSKLMTDAYCFQIQSLLIFNHHSFKPLMILLRINFFATLKDSAFVVQQIFRSAIKNEFEVHLICLRNSTAVKVNIVARPTISFQWFQRPILL